MDTLDTFRDSWKNKTLSGNDGTQYDAGSFRNVVKSRVKKQTGMTMRYFWPAFTCQIMVYAMLSHVAIKYGADASILLMAITGIIMFIPITWIMMNKFKKIATLRVGKDGITSMIDYITGQRKLINDFFTFKKRYELILIPLASFIGVWLTFEIFFPGGFNAFVNGAMITYAITLASCGYAIFKENKRNFRAPLEEMEKILADAKLN